MVIDFQGESLKLNLYDKGSGNALLFLHGWGTSMAVYRNLLSALSQYRRVISYDIPGFGESSEPSVAFSTDDYAELALCVLKALGIEKASFVGHSHGGRTIINLLVRESLPVTVDRAVLIDSAGIVPKKSLLQKAKIRMYKVGKIFLSFAPIKAVFPDALSHFKDRHGSADYRAASPVMRQSLVKVVNDDYCEQFAKISIPTLLIWGDADTATPISDAHLMEERIPDAGLVTVKGGTHFCFLENPTLVNSALKSFLGTNRTR